MKQMEKQSAREMESRAHRCCGRPREMVVAWSELVFFAYVSWGLVRASLGAALVAVVRGGRCGRWNLG